MAPYRLNEFALTNRHLEDLSVKICQLFSIINESQIVHFKNRRFKQEFE